MLFTLQKKQKKAPPPIIEQNLVKSYIMRAVATRAAKNDGKSLTVLVDEKIGISQEDLPKHEVRHVPHERILKMGGPYTVAISMLGTEPEVYTHHG